MKRLIIFLLLLTILFLPYAANAQSLEPPSDGKIDYEKYEDMYEIAKDAMDLADERKEQAAKWKALYEKEREDKLEWKQLYKGSEKNLETSTESNERLQDIIDRMDGLLKDSLKGSNLSLITGVVYTPINPENTGILAAFEYEF